MVFHEKIDCTRNKVIADAQRICSNWLPALTKYRLPTGQNGNPSTGIWYSDNIGLHQNGDSTVLMQFVLMIISNLLHVE